MSAAKWAVIVFPGSNCEKDCVAALGSVLGYDVREVWHKDSVPDDVDCIVIPGGFSYGDYLRAGSLASMSPVMKSVKDHAARGTLVIGICNGFQVLCESGLLPGVLIKNRGLRFRCMDQPLRVEKADTPFTSGQLGEGDVITLPIAHGYGNYFAHAEDLEAIRGQVVFTYCDAAGRVSDETNPNGSVLNIAGICNEAGNVLGMMPHPERACEAVLGGEDGRAIFRAMEAWRAAAPA